MKIGIPKRTISTSNHAFSGAIAVSFRGDSYLEWFTWPSIDPVLRARTQCWAEKQRALQFLGRLSETPQQNGGFASMGSLPKRRFFFEESQETAERGHQKQDRKDCWILGWYGCHYVPGCRWLGVQIQGVRWPNWGPGYGKIRNLMLYFSPFLVGGFKWFQPIWKIFVKMGIFPK